MPAARAWSMPVALAVALLALAALLAYTVRRENAVRASLIIDTHRGVADLVAARLAAEVADAGRAIGVVLEREAPAGLAGELSRIEGERAWLAPLVMIPASRDPIRSAPATGNPPVAATSLAFDEAFAEAERQEHAVRSLAAASTGYSRAAALTADAVDRLRALNGAARALLKANRPADAATIYRQVIARANPFVPAEARWALVAKSQLLECDPAASGAAPALDLYQFLIDYRFFIERDEWEFYANRITVRLAALQLTPSERAARSRLDERREILVALDAVIRDGASGQDGRAARRIVAGPRVAVAHVLTPQALAVLSGTLFAPDGPWTSLGVAVLGADGQPLWSSGGRVPDDAVGASGPIDGLGPWRVVAFPRDGSVAAATRREATRHGVWLALLFGAVALALVLAARSVSRELALSRLRADFVASVSHELKTPLSLIRMFGESLREGWVNEAQKPDYYEVITRESERLTGLIDNVLDFSRIEAGTRQYRFAEADLREIVDGLLARYAFHLKAANVELAIDRPGGPLVARIDRDAVEQVLVNLLSNAVKYMGDASRSPRRVTVSLAREGARAILSVADTGIGMSVHDRARVFERFYRAGDERVRSMAGSGLGLTLVRAHVEAHGGLVRIESTLDEGSTFTIDLPLAAAGAPS